MVQTLHTSLQSIISERDETSQYKPDGRLLARVRIDYEYIEDMPAIIEGIIRLHNEFPILK